MVELFKQTSVFNVKSVMGGNAALTQVSPPQREALSDDEEGRAWGEMRRLWSDSDDEAHVGLPHQV